ncbi:hypothetical protein [Rhodococcus aetherivorans]|uniref:hypothetical protein n=1 Tax=Rhodococcus aetherivorans TaxID=191292 RepID=UPI0035E3CB0B
MVHERVFERLAELFIDRIAGLKLNPATDETVPLSPLIDARTVANLNASFQTRLSVARGSSMAERVGSGRR